MAAQTGRKRLHVRPLKGDTGRGTTVSEVAERDPKAARAAEVAAKPIQVLHALGPSQGGMREHVRNLLKFADQDRFLALVCGDEETLSPLAQELVGVKYLRADLTRPLGGALALVAVARRERPGLMHSHGYKAAAAAAVATRVLRGVRHLATVHTLLEPDAFSGRRGRLVRRATAWALGTCAAVIAVSESVRSNLLLHFPQLADRVRLIHNGYDRSRHSHLVHRSIVYRTLGLDPNAPVVGAIGRLSPEKGMAGFIRAARAVVDAGAYAQFVIVGDGPDKEQLEELAHSLGISSSVHMVGYRSDAGALIHAFDVMVIPSRREAFGLVALEALATDVAIVATNADGLREVLNDEVARTVEVGDTRAMARAIVDAMHEQMTGASTASGWQDEPLVSAEPEAEPEEAVAPGTRVGPSLLGYDTSGEDMEAYLQAGGRADAARAEILSKFDARRMAQETQELYGQVLSSSGRRRS